LREIEDFLRTSDDNEKIILQKYADRYFFFSVFIIICNCLAVVVFSCGPLLLLTKFPIEVWYPFPIESPIAIRIFYTIQVYCIIKTGLNFMPNFILAILFLYSSARLEMLCLKIQNAKNKRQINSCIKKHQKIIKYMNEIKHTVKYILLKTNIMTASLII
ncbi:hypothetical protein EAG_14617, partial [Camponotus floridanus]